MLHRRYQLWILTGLALALATGQGCSSMKWFHSGNDEQSALELDQSRGHSGNDALAALEQGQPGRSDGDRGMSPDYPSLTRKEAGDDSEGGTLSGLSPVVGNRVTGEERLSRSRIGSMLQPVDRTDKVFAELRREETAAIAAGLEDVFYGYDRWTVQGEGVESLSHDAHWLKDNPKAVLKISGHCDERGSHDYNLILGEKRAKAAKSYLVELGVDPRQVAIVSYGKDRPFCSENDEHCYQQNRRGHMLLKTK
ncbi:MAG: OmpA family protein [Nitrospiraceae bacterium]